MQPTCVNPDELTEVVYSDSPEMKDDELRKLLGDLPTQIADALNPSRQTESAAQLVNEPRGTGIGRWVAIVGGVLGILVVVFGGIRYIIRSEITTGFEKPNQDFGTLRDSVNSLRDKEVGGLHKDMDHIQEDLGRVQDWQARVTFSAPGKPGGRSLNIKSDEIKGLAVRARERKIPADIAAIQAVATPLEHNHDQASWEALIELVNL